MLINKILTKLKKAILSNNKAEISKIEHELIHPSDGAYFAIYKHSNIDKQWYIEYDNIFDNKQSAENYLNLLKERYNNTPFDKFEIRRIVIHETNISNYL